MAFARRLFGSLGLVGLSIVVAALVFGVLAGGVIVHRLEATPASSQQQEQQGDNSDQQDQVKGHGNGHTKSPHPVESPDPNEND